MTGYLAREIGPQVEAALESLPVVVVTGLRQAGKTTFLQREPALAGRRYVTLDDLATLEAARADPEGLLAGPDPVTIDEAQRCPELLVAVKRAVDRDRRPGRVLLSGSANFALLHSITETLAGRAIYLELHPFSRRERLGATSRPPFVVRFWDSPALGRPPAFTPVTDGDVLAGGMPSVVLGEAKRQDLWFTGYEQTYLERDVRELAQVADLVTFRSFLRLAALRTGQLLNQSALARDAKLSAATAGRYLGLLETSYVLARLPPYLRSRASRLVKSPKLFLSDAGLAAHLCGVRDVGPGADEPMRGPLYETYVAQNLAAILGAHWPDAELGFWNVQGRHEVDFVVSRGRNVLGVEVKAAARFTEADLMGLRAFAAGTSGVRAVVLAYGGAEAVSLGDGAFAIPIGLLLS
jgi:predicted AAA+ superfamily ATPase